MVKGYVQLLRSNTKTLDRSKYTQEICSQEMKGGVFFINYRQTMIRYHTFFNLDFNKILSRRKVTTSQLHFYGTSKIGTHLSG